MKISVLGSGCATCKKLYETVKKVGKELNINTDIEYSTDVTRIIEMGLMRSPVLVINGSPVEIESNSEKDVKEAISKIVKIDTSCCVEKKCRCSDECC